MDLFTFHSIAMVCMYIVQIATVKSSGNMIN